MTKPRPFGHYFILEKIAQGGMAEIFKGLTYDFSGLKKFIVIKRILPHIAANQDFIHMLVDEAKIAVRLSHGNIAQTFDLGKVAEDYFIVMEYVDGRTISQIFKKSVVLKEFLPIPMVTFMAAEISNGLDYIHRRTDEAGNSLGIVHCDISPQNVIVSPSGNVKIVDFGVAKAAFKLSEKERGVLKGKFAYMSPEQTEGVFVDARSDIFSTGVLLWEALTGRRLFKKKANSDTIEAVNTMTVYPPSAYRNDIPSDLDEIVLKALARDPEERFASAADLSLALTKFNLKHFPEFKAAQIDDLLAHLFEDEDNTTDLYHEKTHHEEVTFLEKNNAEHLDEEERTPAEDTVILDPQELDFHSLFDEIEVDEVSEVTQAIHILPNIQTASPKEEDEPTGDLPEPSLSQAAPAQPLEHPKFGKQALIALGVILAILLLYLFGAYFFSSTPGKLNIFTSPSDAKVLFNGEKVVGNSPLELSGLKPRTEFELNVSAPGYVSEKRVGSIFPGMNKTLRFELVPRATDIISITSTPSGAALYLDGQMTGQKTPLILETQNLHFPVLIGLSISGPAIWSERVEKAPQAALKLHADLTAPLANLELNSTPSGASVSMNGSFIGKTPLYSIKLPAEKEVSFRLELAGYRALEKQISLKTGKSESIHWVLQIEPAR